MSGKRITLRLYSFANPDGLHDFAVVAGNLKQAVDAITEGHSHGQVGYFRRYAGNLPMVCHLTPDMVKAYRQVLAKAGTPFRRRCSVHPRPPWEEYRVEKFPTSPAEGETDGR